MKKIIVGLLVLLVILGGSNAIKKSLIDFMWGDSPAPWETVNAFYYPDKNDLTIDQRYFGFDTLAECRNWVYEHAAENGDPHLDRGDYECGVGCKSWEGSDIFVCRLTIR